MELIPHLEVRVREIAGSVDPLVSNGRRPFNSGPAYAGVKNLAGTGDFRLKDSSSVFGLNDTTFQDLEFKAQDWQRKNVVIAFARSRFNIQEDPTQGYKIGTEEGFTYQSAKTHNYQLTKAKLSEETMKLKTVIVLLVKKWNCESTKISTADKTALEQFEDKLPRQIFKEHFIVKEELRQIFEQPETITEKMTTIKQLSGYTENSTSVEFLRQGEIYLNVIKRVAGVDVRDTDDPKKLSAYKRKVNAERRQILNTERSMQTLYSKYEELKMFEERLNIMWKLNLEPDMFKVVLRSKYSDVSPTELMAHTVPPEIFKPSAIFPAILSTSSNTEATNGVINHAKITKIQVKPAQKTMDGMREEAAK